MEAVKRGMHAIVTKPVVKTLKEHRLLHEAARDAGVLVMVEVHKRFDPIYVDARDRIRDLGGMSYMYSYMSQPKVRRVPVPVDIIYICRLIECSSSSILFVEKERRVRVKGRHCCTGR